MTPSLQARARYRRASCCRAVPIVLGLLLAVPVASPAQDPDVTYTRQQVFRIPFQTDSGERRLKQVQLYVSTDQGRSWHPFANVRPDEGYFTFTANRDGLYWFTVRTIDMDNRAFPLTMDTAQPGLKVVVDTQPPVVTLRPFERDGQAGVEWDVRDDNLDPNTLVIEARAAGRSEWAPLPVQRAPYGQYAWRVNENQDVRLRIRDRAGNEGSAQTTLTPGGGSAPAQPVAQGDSNKIQENKAVRLVNSKRINFDYEVKEVGRSGVSAVELWYTQDGRNWQKYSEDTAHRSPYVVDVNSEGLYGFTLLVRSGVGLADKPPQVGDPPQVWVEVDLTKPKVNIQNVDVGKGAETGNLTVTWVATDKNLARNPITLLYSEQEAGPWTPIAKDLENTGNYMWRMPTDVPYKFFVRVEAADRAGNIGTAETGKSVIVDLAKPKGVILGVSPGQ
ncbi:MAG: hypothetical protein AB7K24_03720 [Gemmataceae bacterium]